MVDVMAATDAEIKAEYRRRFVSKWSLRRSLAWAIFHGSVSDNVRVVAGFAIIALAIGAIVLGVLQGIAARGTVSWPHF
jgi:hypothetical protein